MDWTQNLSVPTAKKITVDWIWNPWKIHGFRESTRTPQELSGGVISPLKLDELRNFRLPFSPWSWIPVLLHWNSATPVNSGLTPADSSPTSADFGPTPADSSGVWWLLQESVGNWKVLTVEAQEGAQNGCGRIWWIPQISSSPIPQNRLKEEDGPTVFDDLEAHVGGQGPLFPEETMPALDQFHYPKQTGNKQKGKWTAFKNLAINPRWKRCRNLSSSTRTQPPLTDLMRKLFQSPWVHTQASASPRPNKNSTDWKVNGARVLIHCHWGYWQQLQVGRFCYYGTLIFQPLSRMPRPIIDLEKCIFAIYAGMPFDNGYLEACACLFKFIQAELKSNKFHHKEQCHNHSDFVLINFGISQEIGKADRMRLSEGKHAKLIWCMLDHLDLQHITSFQDSA